jgi:hypothetical protein
MFKALQSFEPHASTSAQVKFSFIPMEQEYPIRHAVGMNCDETKKLDRRESTKKVAVLVHRYYNLEKYSKSRS